MRALAEGIRHHAVDADSRKQKRHRREGAEKLKGEAPLGHRSGDDFIHRPHAEHGNIGIERLDFVADGFAETFRVGSTA